MPVGGNGDDGVALREDGTSIEVVYRERLV